MATSQLICVSLESAINQALRWSSNAEELLVPLANKNCIIYIQEFEQALIFCFGKNAIQVLADPDSKFSKMPEELDDNQCWVSVSLFALDKLKQNNQMTKLIKSGKLDFAGNLSILQRVSRLFDTIDLDFEEILSGYIGDVPAYQFTHSLKKFTEHAQQQFTLFSQTLSDTALDEKPIGVRKIMVVNFCEEVSIIRADVDRLDAKLTILEEKIKQHKGEKPL